MGQPKGPSRSYITVGGRVSEGCKKQNPIENIQLIGEKPWNATASLREGTLEQTAMWSKQVAFNRKSGSLDLM
jgi:hypothetical protein